MNTVPLPVKDAYIVNFQRHKDQRGHLEEIYNEEKYPKEISRFFPVRQGTIACSHKNVLRGLHISSYCKLLTCVRGAVYDVVVDVRPESATYLKWAAVKLTEANQRQLFIPPNCGHGYFSIEEGSMVVYCQGGCFNPAKRSDTGISPFDPTVNVYWPLPEGEAPIVSEKDMKAENLNVGNYRVQAKRPRILIIGASGQVGSALMESLEDQKEKYVSVGTYNSNSRPSMMPFDMEQAAIDPSYVEIMLDVCRPNIIIICAAFSWVDGNEIHKEKAEAINVLATEMIARRAKQIGSKVVFYSSDYVFDGENNKMVMNSEMTEACPPNSYGQFKVHAEQKLLGISKDNLVLRISRVYGPDEQGKNFIYQVLKCSQTGKKLHCLTDEISCATYNRDVAAATLKLLEKGCSGIYHCSGPDPLNKYDWGLEVADYFKLDPLFLIKTTQDEGKAPAKRPKYCAMDSSKLRKEVPGFTFRTLMEAFEDWRSCPRGEPVNWPQ